MRADIVGTRAELGDTIDHLRAKLDVKSRARDQMAGVTSSARERVDQAKHAALGMLGRPSAYHEVPWFWSDQYDLKLQIAGLAKADDVVVLRGDPASRKFSAFHLRDGVVAAVEAINSAPEYIAGRRLIAARVRVAPERLADPSVPARAFG